jgi:FkbM family methyltransferase
MRCNPLKSYTWQLFRELSPYVNLPSVLTYRDHFIRLRRGDPHADEQRTLRLRRPGVERVHLRTTGSDFDTFYEVFVTKTYRAVTEYLRHSRTVVDLGANIGLASLYFAMEYPACHLCAVEPAPDNFQLLKQNLEWLESAGRCTMLEAAVWHDDVMLGIAPAPLTNRFDSYRVLETAAAPSGQTRVPGISMPRILEHAGFDTVDVLKVDIEGSEVALFRGSLDWLRRVRLMAIEFHGDAREESEFDNIMTSFGFRIDDRHAHTTIAFRDD